MLQRLLEKILPPICDSKTPEDKDSADLVPCQQIVERRGQRCDECWELLINNKDPFIRMLVATDPDVAPIAARRLATDKDPMVLRAMADQSHLHEEASLILAESADIATLEALATKTAYPRVQARLSERDTPLTVMKRLLANTALANDTLRSLQEHRDPLIAEEARARSQVISDMPIIAGA